MPGTQVVVKVKKGEVLFNEGDPSKSMYFIQNGSIRLYKKKGASSIELGVIHKGEVIGEMGFLDGGPRSASAEAIYDTDLVEINSTNMAEQFKNLPQWLMVMLKTIVNRLRTANNKIRQLESSSTALSYGADGAQKVYEFLTTHEAIKICTAVLLCASRGGELINNASKCELNRIIKYAHGVMGVPQAKITELVDLLERIGAAKADRTAVENVLVYVLDPDYIEGLITFIIAENIKEASKKIKISHRGLIILGFVAKHLSQYPADPNTGFSEINLARIMKAEKAAMGGKDPFRLDEYGELVTYKLAGECQMKDADNIFSKVNAKELIRMFRMQRALKEIDLLNEKKRGSVSKGMK